MTNYRAVAEEIVSSRCDHGNCCENSCLRKRVAEAIQKAVEDEREENAKIAEALKEKFNSPSDHEEGGYYSACDDVTNAIRSKHQVKHRSGGHKSCGKEKL